jgi:hypothetical protein
MVYAIAVPGSACRASRRSCIYYSKVKKLGSTTNNYLHIKQDPNIKSNNVVRAKFLLQSYLRGLLMFIIRYLYLGRLASK